MHSSCEDTAVSNLKQPSRSRTGFPGNRTLSLLSPLIQGLIQDNSRPPKYWFIPASHHIMFQVVLAWTSEKNGVTKWIQQAILRNIFGNPANYHPFRDCCLNWKKPLLTLSWNAEVISQLEYLLLVSPTSNLSPKLPNLFFKICTWTLLSQLTAVSTAYKIITKCTLLRKAYETFSNLSGRSKNIIWHSHTLRPVNIYLHHFL